MKRSDMIESIVYNCLSWDGLDTCGVPLEEIANDVLNHLEKMGMLPPDVDRIIEGHLCTENKWEKE